jgi:hypothetical protein
VCFQPREEEEKKGASLFITKNRQKTSVRNHTRLFETKDKEIISLSLSLSLSLEANKTD